ncbi:MAG TPA: hypothetical protein VMB34_08255 [Acetobacteraceae bacterium]|nr:hypothetical protein [Acetobacteraceae bacterium]
MPTLDPSEWRGLPVLGHRMLDDMLDHLAGLREGLVWRPMPPPWVLARGRARSAIAA